MDIVPCCHSLYLILLSSTGPFHLTTIKWEMELVVIPSLHLNLHGKSSIELGNIAD